MQSFLEKLLAEERYDDARKYATFVHLMKKCTDFDWSLFFLYIAMGLILFALIARIVIFIMELIGYEV